jgi:tryptophanyl-tRNA synthetase
VEQHESCPDCHALVADLEAHTAWHSRLVANLANAVEAEIKRTSGAG